MDQQDIIANIERRAKAAGLSIGAICESAGVHRTTFSRWKRSAINTNPVGANLASLTKLETALSQLEASK